MEQIWVKCVPVRTVGFTILSVHVSCSKSYLSSVLGNVNLLYVLICIILTTSGVFSSVCCLGLSLIPLIPTFIWKQQQVEKWQKELLLLSFIYDSWEVYASLRFFLTFVTYVLPSLRGMHLVSRRKQLDMRYEHIFIK